MFGFLTPTRRDDAGPLANVAAVDKFWRLLPQNDPFAAQGAISEALADLTMRPGLGREQLRALLGLDQLTRDLSEALLVNYAKRSAQWRPLEKRCWQSAVALSQSFALAFEDFLRQIRNEPELRVSRRYAPMVLLRLFRHRQVEFLLRPFLNEPPVPEAWTELHAAYGYAHAQGLLHQPVMTTRLHEERDVESTLEQEYIHILLLELMNGGQFSPYDAFWLSRWIPGWCQALSLQSNRADAAIPPGGDHFVVDVDSAEGLKRASPAAVGLMLRLDPSPMLALIGAAIESLRDPAAPVSVPSSFGRARQTKLLCKVAGNYTPRPARVSRRGERKPVASTAKAVIGLAQIVGMLRHEEKKKIAATAPAVPEVEEITITVTGGYTQSPTGAADSQQGSRGTASAFEFGVPHHLWQFKDRSVSGCRLRAPIGDAHRVPPGTLVAVRDDESMRWSLVVVRRIKKRIGDRVDIGVEYIGQNPRGVTMAVDGREPAPSGGSVQSKRGLFTAIYLRESTKQPAMPFKTLILAAGDSSLTQCLTLRSATAEYTVRLKEPIEEQDDFVWLPYEVLDRRAMDPPAQDQTADPKAVSRRPARPQSLETDTGASTDWLAAQPARRAGTAA